MLKAAENKKIEIAKKNFVKKEVMISAYVINCPTCGQEIVISEDAMTWHTLKIQMTTCMADLPDGTLCNTTITVG